ncbi:MAG: carotenoid oxygenase family protein [Actinomycetota bacterium]
MSKWTRGTKAPVTEEIDSSSFVIEGALPRLDGRLVRMAPNPIGEVGADHNWFTGSGMVHAIDLDGGAPARFLNKWVRTGPVSQQLDEPAVVPPVERGDIANTSALVVAGNLLAMTETCTPYVLDDDLRTRGRQDFGAGVEHFTAHPHTDPDTGEVYAVGYASDDSPTCTIYRIGADGVLIEQRVVDMLSSRSVHDFAFTERYVVVWDLPLDNVVSGSTSSPTAIAKWDEGGRARAGLVERSNLAGPITWFELDPCWVFHPVNAYDTDAGVVVDVCQFDKIFVNDLSGPGDAYPPQLWRWELQHGQRQATQTKIDGRVQEYARVNDDVWSKPYRYGYTVELMSRSGAQSIVAHDVQTGESQSWSTDVGRSLSEAVFVPDATDEIGGENAGWLLAVDSTVGHSDLVVLAADDVSSGPVGRVRLPQRIPDGFHGDWIPADDVA